MSAKRHKYIFVCALYVCVCCVETDKIHIYVYIFNICMHMYIFNICIDIYTFYIERDIDTKR